MVTFQDAQEVAQAIARIVHPILVMLFGSVAKRGSGADLDLLIIIDDHAGMEKNAYSLLHKSLKEFSRKFPVDPFIMPVSVFNEYYSKGSPFLRLILKEGRYLFMRKDIIREWLKQAEDELNTAAYLFEGGYFKGACYHSQQSIEKAVKAMLFTKGWELERVHSIERLAAIGEDYKIALNISDEEITFIDTVYRGRYPFEAGLLPLGEPSGGDAGKAVSIARRVFNDIGAAITGWGLAAE